MCEQCHALVHSEQLERLAAEAKALEAKGDLRQARAKWLAGTAAAAADFDASRLDQATRKSIRGRGDPEWLGFARREQLAKFGRRCWVAQSGTPSDGAVHSYFCAKFCCFRCDLLGRVRMKFGIGFAVLILIHEMGHFIDIKRRGLPADMPVFLPGLGAYVRWQALGVPLETRAAISLAGPLAGFFASVACAVIWWQTRDLFWAELARVRRDSESAESDSRLDARRRAGRAGSEQDGTHHPARCCVPLWGSRSGKTCSSWWRWARDIGPSFLRICRRIPAARRRSILSRC